MNPSHNYQTRLPRLNPGSFIGVRLSEFLIKPRLGIGSDHKSDHKTRRMNNNAKQMYGLPLTLQKAELSTLLMISYTRRGFKSLYPCAAPSWPQNLQDRTKQRNLCAALHPDRRSIRQDVDLAGRGRCRRNRQQRRVAGVGCSKVRSRAAAAARFRCGQYNPARHRSTAPSPLACPCDSPAANRKPDASSCPRPALLATRSLRGTTSTLRSAASPPPIDRLAPAAPPAFCSNRPCTHR
jgi:hypothetical protein